MSGQKETPKSLETLLQEAIAEIHPQSSEQDSKKQDYDRDQLREIGEQFSRRYVNRIRSGERAV